MDSRFYVVDDDLSIQRILESIIEKHELGEMIGSANNGKTAIEEIQVLQPDIVLVDLLMPQVDGIGVVSTLKEAGCRSSFVMISQVDSQDMIAGAYQKGIEFFINKPINVVEVVAVIKNVIEKHQLTHMLYSFESAIQTVRGADPATAPLERFADTRTDIRKILANLGISGEAGCQDLIEMVCLMAEEKNYIHNPAGLKMAHAYDLLQKHYKESGMDVNTGTIEQRIRRAVKNALKNLANRGLEDYYDDTFVRYSTILFDFGEVRREMGYLKSQSVHSGKISVRKFIEGIQILLTDRTL